MKRWQIALISGACAVIALIIAGNAVYRKYIIPKYISPVLEQVSAAMNDEVIQRDILNYVEDLEDEGVLDSSVVNKYIARYVAPELDEDDYEELPEEKEEEKKSAVDSAAAKAQAQLGIASVKVNNSRVDENKYSYSFAAKEKVKKSASIAVEDKKTQTETDKNTAKVSEDDDAKVNKAGSSKTGKDDDAKVSKNDGTKSSKSDADDDKSSKSDEKSVSKGTSLYKRAKNAMSASDLSAAYDLATKVDIAYVKSVLSDRKELKSYLTAVLTEAELAKAAELYLKYAYLLAD